VSYLKPAGDDGKRSQQQLIRVKREGGKERGDDEIGHIQGRRLIYRLKRRK